MHSYPLHREIEVECECCLLVMSFTLTSKHDQVICKACIRHVGNSSRKREQRAGDHLGLWRSELQLLAGDRDLLRRTLSEERVAVRQEQARLQGEVDRLTEAIANGLSDTSPADIRNLMSQKVVRDAEEARDAAYRSRDQVGVLVERLGRDDAQVVVCLRPAGR